MEEIAGTRTDKVVTALWRGLRGLRSLVPWGSDAVKIVEKGRKGLSSVDEVTDKVRDGMKDTDRKRMAKVARDIGAVLVVLFLLAGCRTASVRELEAEFTGQTVPWNRRLAYNVVDGISRAEAIVFTLGVGDGRDD